jgi:type I restriction enzyme, S subunit
MKQGWEIKQLGEVYDVRDGTHDSPKYQDEGYPLITSKNLKNDAISFEKIKLISEHDFININKRSKVNIGDILFAMIGTIGNPVVIVEEPHFAIKNVALFKVPQSQHSQFLKYYLDSDYVIKKMENEAKGSTQRFVGLGYLRNFPILLPPLEEQKRIVTKLDECFEATKKARANVKKNLLNIDELDKSILQKAFNGEL